MHISSDLEPRAADRSVLSGMLDDWYVENLRLTFFEVTGWTQHSIFSEIAGVVPTQINAQPPMQLQQETGNFSDAQLSVVQQGSRIDVILSDQVTRNTVDPALPDYRPFYWIGPFAKSLELFNAVSGKTVSLVPGATRVAFGMTLIHKTETVREAIVSLQKHLPTVNFDPNNDLDLIFQINRPTRDQKGRFINRLARWDTIQVTSVRMGANAQPWPSGPPICAARIYLDLSTDIKNTSPIPPPELSEIVNYLRDCAINIAQNGDLK
jgi:hypothetical protein